MRSINESLVCKKGRHVKLDASETVFQSPRQKAALCTHSRDSFTFNQGEQAIWSSLDRDLHLLQHSGASEKPSPGMGAQCCKGDQYMNQVETVQPKAAKEEGSPAAGGDANGASFMRKPAAAVVAGISTEEVFVPTIPKNDATLAMLENAVKGNMLFEKLTSATRKRVFLSMTPLEVLPKTVIIQQGDTEASLFYVLEAGACDALIAKTDGSGSKIVHQYRPGSYFGELALLYDQPRAATVRATAKCKLWVMERSVYNTIFHQEVKDVRAAKIALIKSTPIFNVLSETLQGSLCDALQPLEKDANSVLFYKGDEGELFYIVKEGTVEISIGDKVVSTVTTGEYFGQQALWKTNTPRAATAVTKTACVFYTLQRTQFQSLLGPLDQIWRFQALQKVPILFNLSDSQLLDLAQQLKSKEVAPGEVVIKEGDEGDCFYIIESGTFSCYLNDGTKLALIDRGSCFGELALLHNDKRKCNVAAEKSGGKLLCLERQAFNSLLGDLRALRHTWRFEALRRVPLLQQLSNSARGQLCDILEQVIVPKKTKVVSQGESGDAFYIVETGVLAVIKDGKPVMRLTPGQYFGELALLANEPRAASVVATTDVALLKMSKEDFEKSMGPLAKYLTDKARSNYGIVGPATKDIKLSDLKIIAPLGKGAFGAVSVVKWDNEFCALKQISKALVVKSQLVTHIKAEKRIMSECDSHFLVRMRASFQDSQHLYLLMDFVQGGELFTFMRKRRRALRESWARFYAAAVVMGFGYLSSRDIVYRDLKPENLLIDTNGYLKITDFGFAKKLSPGSKTYTLCGTPEYLAPEVILQQGHNSAADWWTLGILIFELVAGMPPFYDKDRVKMFKKTVKGDIKFPSHFSSECSDLVSKLLQLDPANRLGMQRRGVLDIKQHAWFNGFDWAAFEARTMPAPYVPVVKSPSDARNFEAEKSKDDTDASYKSTGLFSDF